jgi:hypothetical protein
MPVRRVIRAPELPAACPRCGRPERLTRAVQNRSVSTAGPAHCRKRLAIRNEASELTPIDNSLTLALGPWGSLG